MSVRAGPSALIAAVTFAVIAAATQLGHAQSLTLHFQAPDQLQAAATELARMDPQPLAVFAARLGVPASSAPIRVVLAPRGSAVAQTTPSWIAGFANPASGTIVIFPARSPSYPHDSLEAVLRHEIAHVLIGRAAPGVDLPRWLHEGLAMSAERRGRLADHAHLALAFVTGRLTVATLDREFEAGEAAAARAYAVSYALVRDWTARYGADWPGRLLQRLAAGDPIERAFLLSAGVTLAAAEAAFRRGLWWYQVVPFVTSSLVLWMAITLLALYAIRRRTARRAARRQQWDEEDLRLEASPGESGRDP